ncbi:acyl-CoA dehydrogenase [Falsiroseomonas bella]|uniref:Acyl-CoA dehydrogenase n=1 Tax=Falsiroseomonas bella TaxID=2184016 RepID=A0A317F4G2_9PROT|nr:acyl-CoA dehydrogenase family protein [Falsiroseomonas bella]PWS34050.1 acyl-CoA dehydrogenase [Falsiroseomonas bella]
MSDLMRDCRGVLAAAESLLEAARGAIARQVAPGGRLDAVALEAEQFAAHGLAWTATYVEALRQALRWAERLEAGGKLGATERAILTLGFAEYGGQIAGGIPMSQVEMARPADLGLDDAAVAPLRAALAPFDARRMTAACGAMLAALEAETYGEIGLDDPEMALLRETFVRFAAAEVAPYAQDWHSRNALIPLETIAKLGELGAFGVTIPEAHGGLGLGKVAMCLVSEALSEGYVGVGSLGTRNEIAGELIGLNGTEEQKARWLPGIASGEILPTAVFTEPNTGSDLANLRTRAVREGDVFKVYGAKTWITHGSRSDIMTLLVRTNPEAPGHKGLSMLIAEKPRGTEDNPFPAPGMSGSEIEVLGYRGMREYEISFEGFEVPVANLLGGVEGQGFRQLMETFESARIQTAARALGVAQNALSLGLSYARTRIQFGKPILQFPRVYGKLAMMAAETMLARQLTYFAAKEKDAGRRCDVEAGMAKLLAARVAFANADAALQIHGGNGYALEYPISRVLCDARVLSIFEGAAEIQAHIIARGILGRLN